jgi:hypothetical protein
MLHISCTTFYLCECEIFAIAFLALWLQLAAFIVACQWCHSLLTSGVNGLVYCHVLKICWYTSSMLMPSHVCSSLQDSSLNIWPMLVNMLPKNNLCGWKMKLIWLPTESNIRWHFMSLWNLSIALLTVSTYAKVCMWGGHNMQYWRRGLSCLIG